VLIEDLGNGRIAAQRLMQQELVDRTIASRLGPAKPRGIGWEVAGDSVTATQSRQENLSRTSSMIFQRLGSNSRVFDHLAKLVQPLTAAFSADARRGCEVAIDRQAIWRGRRGGRRFCAHFYSAACGAAVSGLVSGKTIA
jgi:hypothetical protein